MASDGSWSGGPGSDGSGSDGSGFDGPGFDGPGFDGPGFDGPGSGGSGFDGRAVVVTGGGSGIGLATALAFAGRGASVLVAGRRPGPLKAAESQHERIRSHVADVRVEAEARGLAEAAAAEWGRIDVVVNNAGAYVPTTLRGARTADLMAMAEANLLAPTLVASACLSHLEATRGAIVNVSSVYARKAAPGADAYAAVKAALESLTRSWALELAPHGVRVNAVAPGPTKTGLLAAAGFPAERIEQITAREAATVPLRRRGEPADLARWIVALADPAASWVTGQVLSVDGGLSLL